MTASKLVKPLNALTFSDAACAGVKAVNLGRLIRDGHAVPDGFCITTAGYRRFVESNGLATLLDLSNVAGKTESGIAEQCREAQAAIASATVPDEVNVAIERARREVAVPPGCCRNSVAVRSSATVEDLGNGSFAGLFESFLNVANEDVTHHVKKCWASLWNVAAITWLMKRFGGSPDYSMAVIIQPMVKAECSGVMFTANPATGNPFEVVINAARGLGEGVVSGDANCDRFIVGESDLTFESREFGDLTRGAVLAEPQVIRLVKTGLEVQKAFGHPQDIEWAFAGDRLYLLQTRPIVNLSTYFPIESEGRPPHGFRKWELEFPDLFSHFGRSLEEMKNPVYSRAREKVEGIKFVNHRTILNGYIYHHAAKTRPFSAPAKLFKVWQLLRLLVMSSNADRRWQNEVVPAFRQQAVKIRSSVAASEGLESLTEAVKSAVQNYLNVEANAVLVNLLGMTFPSLVLKVSNHFKRDSDPLWAASLFSGVPDKTAERDAKLREIVELFHRGQLSQAARSSSTWREAMERLKETGPGAEFLALFERFGEEFGYIWADGNVKDPGWQRDDRLILSMLRNGRAEGLRRNRDVGDGPAESRLGAWYSPRRIILDKLIRQARRYAPYREDHNHYLSAAVMVIRDALLACGENLVQRELMTEPEEIFHLTFEEVMQLPQWVDAGAAESLKSLIRQRAVEFERQKRLTPPSVIDVDSGESAPAVSIDGAFLLIGVPASRGVASGRARVLARRELDKIRRGEILVCHNFRSDWSPVFEFIGGLVANQGYGLTHGANLAREWGVPAVMGVRQATQIIRDGDLLEIDGSKGTVRVQAADSAYRPNSGNSERQRP